jgi:acyl-CoA synthetase (AMP-forming)/AMP-acid ligase II
MAAAARERVRSKILARAVDARELASAADAMNLWSMLERAAMLSPHESSLFEGARSQSYLATRDRALSLVAFLGECGVSRGDRVAVLAQNGIAYFEIYYATAAIGAILVPLNVRLSAREQTETLDDCGARVLFADVELADTVRAMTAMPPSSALTLRTGVATLVWLGEPAVRTLESTRSEIAYEAAIETASRSVAPTPEHVPHDHVAQLYYTSGTTGRSKGVMLTHGNVSIHALAAIGELQLGERDVWAHIAPMFHLADAWATFAITSVGGKHVFLPRFDARSALDLIESQRVTITNLVPTMLTMMLHDAEARATTSERGRRARDWSSLRMILSGGAPIAPDLVRSIIETFACEYAQTYGMTETSPFLTLSLLKERLKSLSAEAQLAYRCKTGRPFSTIELRVVDESGIDVPADEKTAGEIWVRGPTVTPGYWNRPEETRAAFRDGWLKTGDLAVIDSEAYVTIVDRKKDMIITGGEKVFSIEVEHALCAHPAVLECAVFGVPDETWGECVCAAIVVRRGMSVDEAELRADCRARIAAFKVPAKILFVSELPRTGSGKTSKRALRESLA